MAKPEATAEIFVTAFRTLKRAERERVLKLLFEDPVVCEDLTDLALIRAAKEESGKDLSITEYIQHRRLKR